MADDKKGSPLARLAVRAAFIIVLIYGIAWAADRFLLPAASENLRGKAEQAEAYTWDLLQQVAQNVQVKQWK